VVNLFEVRKKVLEENVYIFSNNKKNKAKQGKAKQKKGNGTTLMRATKENIF
jgi:hypothetical protein